MDILDTLKQLRDDIKTWVINNLNALNAKIDEKTIPIDSELSSTSTNPVQNKAIKKAIDNIPTFSGDYNDLTDAPNIAEDDSGNMVIADESGNIIFKADADGLHTTAVSLNGETAASERYVDEAIANIDIPEVDFTGYATEDFVASAVGSAKEELSESIVAESDEWKVVDEAGNIIFSVDADGAHTTSLSLNGQDVEDIINERVSSLVDSAPDTLNTLNELASALGDDPNFATTVVTEIGKKVDKVDGKGLSTNDFTDEYKDTLDNLGSMTFEESDPTVPAWAKAENKPTYTADEVGALSKDTSLFSGDYNDLKNAPDISEDDSGDLVIADKNGNIIFRSNADGFETTKLTTNNLIINGKTIEEIVGERGSCNVAEDGGLMKNENNELAINDEMTFFFVGGTAADIANIPTTERLEGDGQEFYTAAPSTLSFRSTAPLNELQDVQINGETVNPANYELEEGSTIVKLKHDYLSTLRDGQYELAVVSNSKTAKGDFTVASPQLNEYGFYYNQPYYISNVIINDGGMNTVSLNGAFLMAANNTVFVLNQDGENVIVNSYTCENNYFTFAFSGATLTGSFTSNGKSFITSKIFIAGGGWVPDYNGTEQIEFKIDSSAIACDTDYWYFKGINDTLVALPIDKTQSSYVLPKTDICGIPVIRFAFCAFMHNTNLTLINFIPNSFSSISANMCSGCTRLTSINIPNGITIIESNAFNGCTSLTTINFEGTMAQWNAIEKAIHWNLEVPATHVHCIDGDVEI